jgi:putative ubiquitin-RnfH superfamily antitoxin RatB of RatAB toxin-antitoxin module
MGRSISQTIVDALRDGPLSESQLIDMIGIDSTRTHPEAFGAQIRRMVQQKTILFEENRYSLYPLEHDDDFDGEIEQATPRQDSMKSASVVTFASIAEKVATSPIDKSATEFDVQNEIGIFKVNHILSLKDVSGKVYRIEMDSESLALLSKSLEALTSSRYFNNLI